jgi:6-phosphogluconolactonase
MFTLHQSPDPDSLAREAAKAWVADLSSRKSTVPATPYLVALSGGRITKNFYAEIVQLIQKPGSGLEALLVTQTVHFFWADERCVPPDDSESNYRMARELLFEPLKVTENQIHRLKGEAPEDVALREAEESVRRIANAPTGQPVLDVIFLGMGEDGHVASLFPGEAEKETANPAIYRAVTAVKPPPRRLTLGYGVIAAAREVRVLVSGAGKEGALKESLSPTGKTPLARVIQQRAGTTIYVDFAPGGMVR